MCLFRVPEAPLIGHGEGAMNKSQRAATRRRSTPFAAPSHTSPPLSQRQAYQHFRATQAAQAERTREPASLLIPLSSSHGYSSSSSSAHASNKSPQSRAPASSAAHAPAAAESPSRDSSSPARRACIDAYAQKMPPPSPTHRRELLRRSLEAQALSTIEFTPGGEAAVDTEGQGAASYHSQPGFTNVPMDSAMYSAVHARDALDSRRRTNTWSLARSRGAAGRRTRVQQSRRAGQEGPCSSSSYDSSSSSAAPVRLPCASETKRGEDDDVTVASRPPPPHPCVVSLDDEEGVGKEDGAVMRANVEEYLTRQWSEAHRDEQPRHTPQAHESFCRRAPTGYASRVAEVAQVSDFSSSSSSSSPRMPTDVSESSVAPDAHRDSTSETTTPPPGGGEQLSAARRRRRASEGGYSHTLDGELLEPTPENVGLSRSTYSMRRLYIDGLVGYEGVVTRAEEAAMSEELLHLLQDRNAAYIAEEARYCVNLYEKELGVSAGLTTREGLCGGGNTLAFGLDRAPVLQRVLYRFFILGLIPAPPNVCQVSEMTGNFSGYPVHHKPAAIGPYYGILNLISPTVLHMQHRDCPWFPRLHLTPRSLFVIREPCLSEYATGYQGTHQPFHSFEYATRVSKDYRLEVLFACVEVAHMTHLKEAVRLTDYAAERAAAIAAAAGNADAHARLCKGAPDDSDEHPCADRKSPGTSQEDTRTCVRASKEDTTTTEEEDEVEKEWRYGQKRSSAGDETASRNTDAWIEAMREKMHAHERHGGGNHRGAATTPAVVDGHALRRQLQRELRIGRASVRLDCDVEREEEGMGGGRGGTKRADEVVTDAGRTEEERSTSGQERGRRGRHRRDEWPPCVRGTTLRNRCRRRCSDSVRGCMSFGVSPLPTARAGFDCSSLFNAVVVHCVTRKCMYVASRVVHVQPCTYTCPCIYTYL